MSPSIAFEKNPQPKPKPQDDQLGFGRYFSDHMFICEYGKDGSWHRPRVTSYQSLQIDPGASVLHYGQAIFEGMKAFRGVDGKVRLSRPEMNHARMKSSAERLCMKFIDLELYIESLKALTRADLDWVPSKPGTALYLRPTLIGSEAFLGVRPAEEYIYYVIASPVGNYYGDSIESVKIWVERNFTRAAPGGIGAAKAGGNYAASLLAAMTAKKRGYAQVLWLDATHKKYVEEVGTMNVFFVVGDRVLTPELNGTILPGVTRNSVLDLLRSQKRKVEERPIELAEILEAQRKGELREVFGTGTAAGISPVGTLSVDGQDLIINEGHVGAISAELYKILNDIQYGRVPDTHNWMLEV